MKKAEALESAPQTTPSDTDPLEDWEILTEVLLALVSRPEEVRVDTLMEEDSSHFTIHVAQEDLGKVIGKNGETVSVLRKLFGRIAAGRGRKSYIQVVDPSRTTGPYVPRTFGDRRIAAV